MTPKKIWQLLDSSGIGGIETHVTLLSEALRQRDIDAEIVLLNDHGQHPLTETWHDAGIPVRTLKNGVFTLREAVQSQQPDLIHTHGYKGGILGRLAGLATATPVVSTYHAGEPGTGRMRLYNKLDAEITCHATRIAVSTEIAKRIGGDIRIVPNFVSVPDSPFCGGDNVAFVGRLSHEKGPDRFIEIAGSLPHVPFEVFGDGPMRDALAKNAGANVAFRGSVPSMAPHWRGIGLLCISSRHEGLPLVALEAMANGVPVACFGVGALPDVICDRQEGYVVTPGDMAALTHAVESWSTAKAADRAQMTFRAHRKVKACYGTDAIVPRIVDIYQAANNRTDRREAMAA